MTSIFKLLRVNTQMSSKFSNFLEKFKNGRLENWALYWKGICADYREVARDVIHDARSKPLKASVIATGLGTLIVAIKTNPTEHTFRHQVLHNSNRLSLVPQHLRNPESEDHLRCLQTSQNEGLLRILSLCFFSLMWMDNYDQCVSLYAAQCVYLKPRYLTFYKRIVDVGAFGKWHVVDWKMRDYDININELG